LFDTLNASTVQGLRWLARPVGRTFYGRMLAAAGSTGWRCSDLRL